MTKKAKSILFLLMAVLLLALAAFSLRRPQTIPACDCVSPTGEHGVLKNGECVLALCKKEK